LGGIITALGREVIACHKWGDSMRYLTRGILGLLVLATTTGVVLARGAGTASPRPDTPADAAAADPDITGTATTIHPTPHTHRGTAPKPKLLAPPPTR